MLSEKQIHQIEDHWQPITEVAIVRLRNSKIAAAKSCDASATI